MSSEDHPKEKFDALDRYERMIDVQIETLNGIDDKAEYLTRYLAILVGLAFTGTSILVDRIENGILVDELLIAISLSVLAFLVALVFSILTYLSSVFQYGPNRDFAATVADRDLGPELYSEMMLKTYRSAITENYRVVQQNSKRFKIALAALLNGVLFLAVAAVILVGGQTIGIIALIIVGAAALWLTHYIITEQYLTLEREELPNE